MELDGGAMAGELGDGVEELAVFVFAPEGVGEGEVGVPGLF